MSGAASTIGADAEGEVIVTAALRARLRGAFATMVLPGARRGAYYRVIRARKRLGLDSGGGRLTPFTGRELELAQLEQWWRDASSGRGQVAMISGEAGLGKSRIARELWQRVRGEALGCEARCSSLHSNTPLFPFMGMMAQIARLEPDDDGAVRTAKLRSALAPLGPRGDQLMPLFSAWLFPDAKATPAFGSTDDTDRRAAVAAIEECLLLLAETRPVLLLCEDIHWSDPTTREAIDRLVNLVRTAPVLLVLTFRPDFVPPWGGSGINHLALQPLRLEEARAMVAALPTHGAEDLDNLIARADGNPLFLEELARHADDSRAPLTASSVPLSLRDLLAARLDRMGAAKHLAQVAAVCGRTVSYPLLAALCKGEGYTSDAFDLSLANLVDSEIFEQRGLRHSATFTFRHALLRECAYGSLSPRDRRRTRELVAHALPALEPDSVASHPELSAALWTEVTRLDRAFEW
jgi:predicted ATPase